MSHSKGLLIVCPVHTKLNTYTLRCIFELDTSAYTYVDYYMPSKGYTTEDINGNFDSRGRLNLTGKQNRAREIANERGYDILFVEEDMLIPSDTVNLLLECNSDVAYSLYIFRYKPYLTSCWLGINEDDIYGISIDKFPGFYKQKYNSIVDCDGVGFGCTLIKSNVLKSIPFRIGWNDKAGDIPHSDMFFAVDCIKYGFTQRCNLACKCGHIYQEDKDGQPKASILYPDDKEVVTFISYKEFTDSLEGI